MNLAAISGAGWAQYKHSAYAILLRMSEINSTDTLLIDFETIAREHGEFNAVNSSIGLKDVDSLKGYVLFERWMKDSRLAIDGIDAHAILSTAEMIPASEIVIIDARNYSIDLIVSALEKARLAWYPLDEWHPTFAVICDDVYILQLLTRLTSTFYSQPQVLSERELKLIVSKVRRRAFVYRWFGSSVGRFAKSVSKATEKVKYAQDKLNDYING